MTAARPVSVLLDRDKVFVELDLSARYADVHAPREGRELRKLWG